MPSTSEFPGPQSSLIRAGRQVTGRTRHIDKMYLHCCNWTDYGETRYIGFGHIQGRLMAVVFTERLPDVIRIISLRKANQREKAFFEREIENRLGAS
jgi:uncharacterized DUF497 family protein